MGFKTSAKRKIDSDWKRQMIQMFKGVPCSDCGQKYPPYVMDFDHKEAHTKEFTIARVVAHGRWALLVEMSKCDVVCSNCHRIRTHKRKLADMAK
jgi:hypothetical protein